MSGGRPLRRALGLLIALGLGTTGIAVLRDHAAVAPPALAAAALLALAGLKAEIILSRYLGLRLAPAWLGGFRAAVLLLLGILYALWLIPLLL